MEKNDPRVEHEFFAHTESGLGSGPKDRDRDRERAARTGALRTHGPQRWLVSGLGCGPMPEIANERASAKPIEKPFE